MADFTRPIAREKQLVKGRAKRGVIALPASATLGFAVRTRVGSASGMGGGYPIAPRSEARAGADRR